MRREIAAKWLKMVQYLDISGRSSGEIRNVTADWVLWRDRRGRVSALRIMALALLLFPLVKAAINAPDILQGARPLNDVIHRTGFWTLVFLGVTLAITPLRAIARYGQLVDVRRMLGVGTFCYGAAHIALYVADQSYDLAKVVHEITHRVYLIIGMVALIGLTVLAITSTDRMTKRIGPLRWRRLHQLVYVIALFAIIHYFQQTKADVTVPVFVAGLFAWLIGYRIVAWWQDRVELSTLSLLVLTLVVSLLTFLGEAVGIGLAFGVSPLRVLDTVFDFDAGIRPGWQVLAAGLAVVVLDIVRARWNGRRARTRPAAA